jgi:hypothetical protein
VRYKVSGVTSGVRTKKAEERWCLCEWAEERLFSLFSKRDGLEGKGIEMGVSSVRV